MGETWDDDRESPQWEPNLKAWEELEARVEELSVEADIPGFGRFKALVRRPTNRMAVSLIGVFGVLGIGGVAAAGRSWMALLGIVLVVILALGAVVILSKHDRNNEP